MFTERVRLLNQIRPPKDGVIDGPWLAKFLDVLKNTFGDCNAPLTHRGPITVNRPDVLTAPGTNGTRVPLDPYNINTIDPDDADRTIPQASVTFTGGDSFLDMDTQEVHNGLDIYADGANYLGDGIFENVIIKGDLIVNGNCSGCGGGDPGEPSVGVEPQRFVLTTGLERNGYATGNILTVSGGIETVAVTGVTLGGWSGQWYGNPGAKGWCVQKQDSKNDNGTAGRTYHVLWLDTWFMKIQLQSDLSLGGTASAQQVVGDDNTPVGEQITVIDHLSKYRARNGALGIVSVFQDQPNSFLIRDIQTDCERIVVIATSDGGGLTIQGTLLRGYRGRYPVEIGSAIEVYDPEERFALVKSGAKLECEFNDREGRYEVAEATVDVSVLSAFRFNTEDKQYEYKTRTLTVWCASGQPDNWTAVPPASLEQVTAMTNWRTSGLEIQGKFQTFWVPKKNDETEWTLLEEGEEC